MAKRSEVAKAAGVSESTVSYALTGSRPISEETKRRVFKAMEDLDYKPNAMAQALRSGKSKMIAMLFGDQERGLSDGDLDYVMAAAAAAKSLGYHLILWPIRFRAIEDVVLQAESGLLAGVVLMEVSFDDLRVKRLKEAGIPYALIGRTANPEDDVYADRDFESALQIAVAELVRLGHSKLVFLSTSTQEAETQLGATVRSENAAVAAAKQLGAEMAILHAETSIDSGIEAAEEFMRDHSEATGVVTVNATGVIGFSRAVQRAGLSIPADLSIICISTSDVGAVASDPALTTVTPPAADIGAAAIGALVRQLENVKDSVENPAQKLFVGELTSRGTTGPAPGERRS